VVELFKKQISDGGPVTVTDPEIKRYFMTAREAVELVLAASALGSTQKDQVGKIYVLDMGDPVFIRDLAKQMIRLAGYTPEKDIKIIYTGLRAGEKLFEEIFHNSEKLEKTLQSGILLAAPRINSLVSVMTVINAILEAIDANDFKVARAEIFNLVPEYNPPQNN
jgi:O-antigen biosynthesis protein WbqV